MKPLELDGGKSEKPDGEVADELGAKSTDNEVFVKTESITEKKKQEKIRERLETFRDKRKINKKLKSVKKLAAQDDDEDVSSWVNKSRKLQEEKAKALEKAE